MLDHIIFVRDGFVALCAEEPAPVHLQLVEYPVISSDVQFCGVLALLERADIRTQVPKDMAPASCHS